MADAYPLKLVDNGDGNGKLVQFASGDTIPRDNLPVQSSTWDTTDGALLQVGAFGANGGPARIMSSSTDANTLTTSGVYVFPDGGTNMPSYVYSYLEVITHRDTNFVKQIAHGMNNNQMFTRQRFDGTWGAWTRIYTADTILGQVTRSSGGLPTGAIIERGSNGNGEYVRFADGAQWCWGETGKANVSISISPLYCSPDIQITFPAAFASEPNLNGMTTRHEVSISWVGTDATPTSTGGALQVVSWISSAIAAIKWTAIGWWY